MRKYRFKIDIKTDDDTVLFFEIAADLLIMYFGVSETVAKSVTEKFYAAKHSDDDFFHHYSPYTTAAMIYYVEVLNGNFYKFREWELSNGHHHAPFDALQYYHNALKYYYDGY